MNTNETEGTMGGDGRQHWKRKLGTGFFALAVSGSLLLLALFVTTVKEYGYIGRDVNAQTTISVSGDGDAYATPDIATVSFSITQDAKTQSEARKLVDDAMKKTHDFLTAAKVGNNDIKTTAYDLYPKYDYISAPCPLGSLYPCPSGKQVLTGYTASESVDVKIRVLDDAGTILGGLADNGATNLSGLSFTVEKPDAIQAAARKTAIDKAQAKANELAKELGVKLVRIVSFNEGGGYPVYNYGLTAKAADMSGSAPAAANIPIGQNKFTSNVTITYEIR